MSNRYIKDVRPKTHNMATAGTAPLTDPGRPVTKKYGTETKRLNLILSGSAYDELLALSQTRHTSMKEIVRLGIGLVKIAINETRKGNKLIIATPNGEAVKELVIPG